MKHNIEELKLKNGAKLINVIVKDLPITIVSVWFKAGSRFDPVGKEGLAHFLEHLYMKKTKRYPNEIERLKEIESRGIKFNAWTGYESVHYYNIQLKDETYASLEFLIDGLDGNILDGSDIEKEKGIVINEMLENKLNPREYIWNMSNQALWKNSAMGRSFFGNRKSIKSINKKDIEKFIKQYYIPKNCTFVVVGSENTAKLGEILNKRNSTNNDEVKISREVFKQPKKISILKNKAAQVTIAVAFKTFSMDGDLRNLAVMDFIRDYLSNKWISKFVEELRLKRNITYWVSGETENFSDTGSLRFIYACDKKHALESIEIILSEIKKIKSDSFKSVKLDHFKKSFLSSLAIKFTDPYEYLWWYGWQATALEKEKLLTIEQYSKLIQEIKAEDMQAIVKKYLNNENVSISLIGDVEKDKIKL